MKHVALVATSLWFAACSGGDDTTDRSEVVEAGFAVFDGWTRPTPPGRSEAAIYVTIENQAAPADRLIGSASERCMVMHPHLTSISDDGVASMLTANGDQLAIPEGGTLELVPNALHLMCLGLAEELVLGDTFDIELQFSEHDPVTVPVVVANR